MHFRNHGGSGLDNWPHAVAVMSTTFLLVWRVRCSSRRVETCEDEHRTAHRAIFLQPTRAYNITKLQMVHMIDVVPTWGKSWMGRFPRLEIFFPQVQAHGGKM
ncbi:unnamed protein product [Sphacelaria rigidula]